MVPMTRVFEMIDDLDQLGVTIRWVPELPRTGLWLERYSILLLNSGASWPMLTGVCAEVLDRLSPSPLHLLRLDG